MILAKYKYSVNTFLVLCYLTQNIVDNAIRLMYSIGRDRALNTKTEGRNNLMKKRISLALTVLLALSVCVLPFATQAEEVLRSTACEEQGHPLTITISSNKNPQQYTASQHKIPKEVTKRCACGDNKITYIESYSYEKHTIVSRVSPHSEGKHNVTRLCDFCGYVQQKYSYDCPGNPCIYPESQRPELY